jgi:tetratricopeptide (TPR) repeat protein
VLDSSEMAMKCTKKGVGQLIALYEVGALDGRKRRAFLDHLIECEYCYDKLYAIEPAMIAFRNHRDAARARATTTSPEVARDLRLLSVRPRVWRWSPALTAASVMAVCGLVLFLALHERGRLDPVPSAPGVVQNLSPWKDIEIPTAEYRPLGERSILRTPVKSFDRAMAAYQAGDFSAAAEKLQTLIELESDVSPEVRFYLGVSLLKVGRMEDAISSLKRVVESTNQTQQEAAHFYLALASLRMNQPQQAITEFDAVVMLNGNFCAEARKIRQQVIEVSRSLGPTKPSPNPDYLIR